MSYIAMGDLSSYNDKTIIKNIEMAPTQEGSLRQQIVSFWGENTIMGVAKDAEGVYGPVTLQVINLDQSNVSPAADLLK